MRDYSDIEDYRCRMRLVARHTCIQSINRYIQLASTQLHLSNDSYRHLKVQQDRMQSSCQRLAYPIHLHRTHPPRITPVCKHILIVQDRLDLLPKQHARRMDRHRLVAHHRAIAAVGYQARRVGREPGQEALQDQHR